MTPAHGAAVTSLPRQSLSLRVWVFHPITRATGGLLGPCFKTGRFETTFMHQSFAPKQHLQAKTRYDCSLRRDLHPYLAITRKAPTLRRRSIPHSAEPRFPPASSTRKSTTNTRSVTPQSHWRKQSVCDTALLDSFNTRTSKSLDHFLLNGFTHYLTLIPKFFSTFHHCTFSLSVSCYI